MPSKKDTPPKDVARQATGRAAIPEGANAAKPLITEFATPERLAAIPDDVNLSVPQPKGHHGLCVGRKRELQQIHGYFATQYRAEEQGLLQEGDCVACIITNAPGSGKTTLREEFVKQARQQDVGCIELTTGQVMDPAAFIESIVNYAAREPARDSATDITVGTKIRARLRRVWKKVKPLAPGLIGVGVGTAANLVAPPSGAFIGWVTTKMLERKNRLAAKLADEIEGSEQPMTVVRVLQLLSDTHDGQYLLTVDEAHVWAEPNLERDRLHTMLSLLCNPSARKEAGIRGGGLLLSGLGIVKDNLDGLGLSRAEIIWVDELTEENSIEIITHAIKQLPKARLDSKRRKRIIQTWPESLAGSFTHWPQHAAIAGQIAKLMILQSPNATAEKDTEHLEWVRTKTAERIVSLYADQLDKAEKDGDPNAPKALAELATMNNGVLPTNAVRRIIERSRSERGLPIEPANIKETASVLKRTGVLRDKRVRLENGVLRDEYRIGIPSLRSYILQAASPQERRTATTYARMALAEPEETAL